MSSSAAPHKAPNYWAVYLALAAITAFITLVEMYSAYIPISIQVIYASFIILAFVKATLVAMYYMHLKFDSYVYTILFIIPVMFAIFLIGMLAAAYLL
jgi:cytochrome c oxidase subunit IV